jgi:hypothetical protein
MEVTNVAEIGNGKRKPRGRIDSDQQDAVIKLDPVREKVEYLEQLYGDSCAAAEEFAEAVKSVAEQSGLLAAVVRKFVVARASEKFDEKKRQCEQLSLLFDDVGE